MHILALLGNMEALLCTKLRIPFLWHHANLTAPSSNERIPDVATPEFHISIVTAPEPAPAPDLSNCVSQLILIISGKKFISRKILIAIICE